MTSDPSLRIAVAFARQAAMTPRTKLCGACVDVLAVAGAGITIMAGRSAGPICVSSERFAPLEDIQFTAGEGPCQDAFRTHSSVHAPQLDDDASQRWPSFVGAAISSGIGSVFAYPLQARGARVGVLTLYQLGAGALTDQQHEDSLTVAEVLTETVLRLQGEAPPGELHPHLDGVVGYRAEIYQASGMVAVHLDVAADDALDLLRAYAFSHERPLADVASDVVRRRLMLGSDGVDVSGSGS